MIHHSERIWEILGIKYTLLDLPFDPMDDPNTYQKRLADWVNAHCEGEWISTPEYIAFRMPSDAVLFRMGFTL